MHSTQLAKVTSRRRNCVYTAASAPGLHVLESESSSSFQTTVGRQEHLAQSAEGLACSRVCVLAILWFYKAEAGVSRGQSAKT